MLVRNIAIGLGVYKPPEPDPKATQAQYARDLAKAQAMQAELMARLGEAKLKPQGAF